MSDGMRRELAYLSSHATNRYFIPNWGKRLLLTTETRKPSHARHKYRRTNSMKPSRASRPRNWSTEKMNRRMKNQTKSRLREVASRILTWQYTPYGRNHHPMRKCDTPERS